MFSAMSSWFSTLACTGNLVLLMPPELGPHPHPDPHPWQGLSRVVPIHAQVSPFSSVVTGQAMQCYQKKFLSCSYSKASSQKEPNQQFLLASFVGD